MSEIPRHEQCPEAGALERALDERGARTVEELDEATRAHVGVCPACARRLRLALEDAEFLAGAAGALRSAADARDAARVALPGYAIIREIARGGQATVYEGLHEPTRRRVAIKVLDVGGGARATARLEREAELAARLHHPNIVTVYSTATLPDRRMGVAMELIDGVPLDQWAAELDAPDATHRDVRRRKLVLVATLADAVQHAHTLGVIHRDLKPANILVDREGVPHIVDFGVARPLDAGMGGTLTQPGAFAGTLAYAAPEQIARGDAVVDTRADVYALGVILHELLTGRRPHDTDESLSEIVRRVTTTEAAPLPPLVPGGLVPSRDLAAVVAMALARDPARRYQTAAALRDDLRALLDHRPIAARSPGPMDVLRQLARRHRLAVALVLVGVLVLAGFALTMAWNARALSRERARLAESLSSSTIERARLLLRSGSSARAESLLWGELKELPPLASSDRPDPIGFESDAASTQAAWALFELYSRQPCVLRTRLPGTPLAMRFEGESLRVLLTTNDGRTTITSLDPALERPSSVEFPLSIPTPAVIDRDASLLLLAREDHLWLATLHPPGVLDLGPGPARRPRWAATTDHATRLATLHADSALTLQSLGDAAPPAFLLPASNAITIARTDPHDTLVLAHRDRVVSLFRSSDGERLGIWGIPQALWESSIRPEVYALAIVPGARRAAVGCSTTLLLYDLDAPGSPPVSTITLPGFIGNLAASPEGSTLLVRRSDATLNVVDASTGTICQTIELAAEPAAVVVLSDDQRRIATAGLSGQVEVFETAPEAWRHDFSAAANSIHSVRYLGPNAFVGVSADGAIQAWDAHAPHTLLWRSQLEAAPQTALAVAPDAATLATTGYDGIVREWDARTGALTRTLGQLPKNTMALDYRSNGRVLAAASGDGSISSIDLDRPESRPTTIPAHQGRAVRVVHSPDGTLLASVGADARVLLWNTSRPGAHTPHDPPAQSRVLVGHTAQVRGVAFSPDGRTLATGADDRTIRLWDVRTGACLRTIADLRRDVFSLVFHPSGNLLFVVSRSPGIQVFDIRTGREVAVLGGTDRETGVEVKSRGQEDTDSAAQAPNLTLSIALSPDGRTLLAAGTNRRITVWQLDYYQPHLRRNEPASPSPR